MQVVGCGPFAAVASAGGETRRAGPPSQNWERRPRSQAPIQLSGAAQGSAPVSAAPRYGLRAAGLGCYQRFFKPGSGRREGIGLIVVCKHLLVVYVEQPTVTDAVDAVWTDTGRWLDVLLPFTFSLGETPTRRSSPSAGLPPEPDAPLPRAGSATEMPKRVDARRTAPTVRQRNGKREMGVVGRHNLPRAPPPGIAG